MQDKKVKFLLGQGCVLIKKDGDTTVLKDKHGNVATVDRFGKVTWSSNG